MTVGDAIRLPRLVVVAIVISLASIATIQARTDPARAAASITYTYEVRGLGNTTNLDDFASLAAETLADQRGWTLGGSIAFQRVGSGGNFTLWLSAPQNVPSFGPPCDSTYSCSVGRNVIVNETRWWNATSSWYGDGGTLRDYRHMVANHEVGHWLGFGHSTCPGPGQKAPVMQQQSISMQGCRHNPWPLESERQTLSSWKGVPIVVPTPTPPGALPSSGPVILNSDGRLEALAIGQGGGLLTDFQFAVGLGWSGFVPVSAAAWPTTDAPEVSRNADGRLEVFLRGGDGQLWHAWQNGPAAGWSQPFPLGGQLLTAPAVARNLDGRLEAFAIAVDGGLWHIWQNRPNGNWSDWAPLANAGFTSQPAVATSTGGSLVAFATTGKELRGIGQLTPGGAWGAMALVGDGFAGRPAAGRNLDGRIEVFGLSAAGTMLHAWQGGFGWSATIPMDDTLTFSQPPVVAPNRDGRLELFSVSADGQLRHAWQHAPNVGWSDFSSAGGSFDHPPALATNPDGRLEVFAIGTDSQLWHDFQVAPNAGWFGLTSLGGNLAA